MNHWKPLGLLLACAFASAAAAAEPDTLTLDQALALAVERSPAVRAAQHQWAAARGARAGAGAPPNPVLEAGVGYRSTSPSPEFEIGAAQALPLAEIAPARASAIQEAVAAGASADDAWRQVVGEVSYAFLGVRYADERVQISADATHLAEAVLRSARARVEAGEAPALEVVLAELDHSRAQARAAGEEASRERALGTLRVALDLDSAPGTPTGSLLERGRYRPYIGSAVEDRADLQALEGQVRAAEARERLAHARALPDLGVWGGYAQEEGASVVTGGVSLEVPLFRRAQSERAQAAVRTTQAREASAQRRRAASTEVEVASRVYLLRLQAVDALESVAIPRALQQTEAVGRAYELGEMGLPELLLIRAQAIDARIEHVDAQLGAALAGVDLLEAAGWTP